MRPMTRPLSPSSGRPTKPPSGKLGFSALEYIGGGKRAEIVLDGGIGSNIDANTTLWLDTGSLRLRYNAEQKLRQTVRWRRDDANR